MSSYPPLLCSLRAASVPVASDQRGLSDLQDIAEEQNMLDDVFLARFRFGMPHVRDVLAFFVSVN